MSLIRWSPLRESSVWPGLRNMQDEIDRVFDGVFRGTTGDDAAVSDWTPAVDILEHENEYVVRVELPGVNRDDVKITLESNVLTIRGEKKHEVDVKKEHYHYAERSHGSFQRCFTLPVSVNGEKIDAVYKDGVLTVTLPKAEEAKPRQIDVQVK